MKGYRSRFILLALVLFGLMFMSLTQHTAAQCSVRTDWPTYRVQGGDTLNRIARRYQTQVSVLMQANCLGSTRIYAGQTLQVPPDSTAPTAISGQRLPTAPRGHYEVGVAYRDFQNGLMIWNVVSGGAIWVFDQTSGRVTEYPLAEYGALEIPRDFATPQPGCLRPYYGGLGTVWYNFPEVRSALGCALTRGEMAEHLVVDVLPFGRTFTLNFTRSDHTAIRVNLDGTWQYITASDPTPLPTRVDSPRIGSTYQPFENGFMVWLATTGDIYVYLGHESGMLEIYASSQYAALKADSSSFLLNPQGGFARVWTNFARDRIGKPVSSETGYLMTPIYDSAGTLTQFNLPDGNYARRIAGSWQVFGRRVPTPAPLETFFSPPVVTPLLTPTPEKVVSTWAAYQPFERGLMLWRQDTDEVYTLSVVDSIKQQAWVYPKAHYQSFTSPTDTPPNSGLFTPINAFGKVWSQPNVRAELGWATAPEQGYNATISEIVIIGPMPLAYSIYTTPTGRQLSINMGYTSWGWVD